MIYIFQAKPTPNLYNLAHVAGWDPYNVHNLARVVGQACATYADSAQLITTASEEEVQ